MSQNVAPCIDADFEANESEQPMSCDQNTQTEAASEPELSQSNLMFSQTMGSHNPLNYSVGFNDYLDKRQYEADDEYDNLIGQMSKISNQSNHSLVSAMS